MMPALGVMMAGASVLAAGGSATAAESGTQAHPSSCHAEKKHFGSVAMCKKDHGGHYRALIVCKDSSNGKLLDFHGGWRNTGWSFAYCQGSYLTPVSEGYETKVS
ncbi:hypothetical protein AMK15_16120 [Streptomyces sp. MJM1172]|nr:hypothetical protein AMK15_16120 [Streptomyces sp. MJM1172]